ncbi:hypothetical protein [Streptomyces sp. NPDC048637]|uniref:hypothetical protein n=1 Tax=Streptomyces sp. NPDC048637 TaxID=3155636 RepID=UPI0034283ED2
MVTHWPDLLQLVGSLVTGQVRAYDLNDDVARLSPFQHANLNVLGATAPAPPLRPAAACARCATQPAAEPDDDDGGAGRLRCRLARPLFRLAKYR